MASNHAPTTHAGKHAAAVSITAADMVTLTIKDLTLNGLLSRQQGQQGHGSVASFRNIKFAEIPGRWHEARLLDLESQKGVWDATRWGPRPPQTMDTMHAMTGHLYPRMSVYDAVSEFECLNLNICTPVSALQVAAKNDSGLLPVIVWIHGGSFQWGDGSCECDGQYLVNRSIQTSRLVLVVSINYRLGMLGFFTSKELRQEARDRGEAGYSNLGLHDQRLALQWVRENIHIFGGDASRILLAGESSGAISVLAHLRGKVPVATSALLMSPATIGPKPFSESQRTFDKVCDVLGIAGQEISAGEKLAALRRLSCEQLHELGADRLESILCEDPVFFQDWSGQRFEEIPAFPPWIKRVAVGELSEEMGVMSHHWATLPPAELLKAWKQLYRDPEYAAEVLSAYNVIGDETIGAGGVHGGVSQRLAQSVAECVSDALFSKAVRSIAETHLSFLNCQQRTQPQVYLYRFDQPDLVAEGEPHRGHAYHSLDNSFLFYFPAVAGEQAPDQIRTTADEFSGAALRLAYGDELWEPLGKESTNKFATFSGDGVQVLPQTPPIWAHLVNTPERLEQFLLGKELLWKAATIAADESSDT